MPEQADARPRWAQGPDDPMAGPLSRWAPTPILARLQVVASTRFWSAQLHVRPDMLERVDLVEAYRDIILSLVLDVPPPLRRLGREIFSLLDDEGIGRTMPPAAIATLRRALDTARQELRGALLDFPPRRVEIHSYLLEGGGASGTSRDLDDDHADGEVDPLLVAKAVTAGRLLLEIVLLLTPEDTDAERIPVRAAW